LKKIIWIFILLLVGLNVNLPFSYSRTMVGGRKVVNAYKVNAKESMSFEETGVGADKVTIKAPSVLASDYTLILPINDGDRDQFLQTNGDGVLSFEDIWILPPIIDWWDPTGGLPVDPDIGDRYGSDGTAEGWEDGYVYEWDGDSWIETEPDEGVFVWELVGLILWVFFSGGWMEEGSGSYWLLDDAQTGITGDKSGSFDIATTGDITADNLNIADWDTAYGWGDHSTEGYLTTITTSDIANDLIKDYHIDWGHSADQVDSDDIPDHSDHTVKDTFEHLLNRGKTSAITITLTGGLGISWTTGEIYDESNNLFVSTTAGSGNLTDNVENYLKWVSGDGLTIATSTSSSDEILIANFAVYDGVIAGYRETSLMNTTIANTRRGLREIFPTRIISGMSVSEDTDVTNDLDVVMDAGVLYKDTIERKTPVEIKSRTTAMIRHYHTAGVLDSDTNAEIDTVNYDNPDKVGGQGLEALPANKWTKAYFIYQNEKIGWVYPTTYYNTKAQAENSALSAIPAGLEQVPKLTAVVYQQNDTDFTSAVWQDIRPGISEESFNTVTDHGSLAGLADIADHPYASLIDGTRAFTGDVTMNKGLVVNESGGDYDFRVEGVGEANALFVQGSDGYVGIGTNTPSSQLDVRGSAVFNEDGADVDFRIEGDTDANLFSLNAGFDSIGVGTDGSSYAKLSIYRSTPAGTLSKNGCNINRVTVMTSSGTSYDKAMFCDITDCTIPAGITDSGYKIGVNGNAFANTAGFAGTLNTQYGLWCKAGIHNATRGAVVNTAYAIRAEILNAVSGTTITNAYGLYIKNNDPSGTITNRWDIYCESTISKSYIGGSLIMGSPTGGSKGAGTINAKAVYDDNVLLTDYVFDKYFDNEIKEEDIDKGISAEYTIPTREEFIKHIEEKRHLPRLTGRLNWTEENRPSLGKFQSQLCEQMEHLAIYIKELHEENVDLKERISNLEKVS